MKQYRISKILLILFFLALPLLIFLSAQNRWLFGMGQEEWTFFTGWSVVIFLVVLLAVAWIETFPQHKVAVIIVLVLILGAMLLVAFAQYVFRADCDYFTFVSPDGQHTVIVKEESFLFASWGTFYQQTSWCTMEQIGRYNLDEVYPNGSFTFTWGEDGCEVSFCGEKQVLNWVD